jgi:predicted ATP-dependent serine protease
MTRPTIFVCSQCGRTGQRLTGDCARFQKLVYADSFRMVGSTLECDGVEPAQRVRT